MSAIYYNGVMLQLTNILDLRQRAVYSDDGSDYLYTHFFLDCECIWNPLATADRRVGAVPITSVVDGITPPIGGGRFASVNNELQITGWLPIVNAVGYLPAVSVGNLRPTLLQPRGLLIVAIGNDILLISPNRLDTVAVPGVNVNPTTIRAPVDAKNGPHPIAADIIGFHGLKSFKMRFTIETWVNECTTAKYILSNRWEVSDEIDGDHYLTTRTVRGKAVFRQDTLALIGLASPVQFPTGAIADDFRRALFLPEPATYYQRRNIRVEASEDGTTINYQFTDEEQTYTLGLKSPVTRIEGSYTQGFRGSGLTLSASAGLHGFGIESSYNLTQNLVREIDLHLWGRSTCANVNLADAAQSVAIYYGFDPSTHVGLGLESIVRFAIDGREKRLDFRMAKTLPTITMMKNGIGSAQRLLIDSTGVVGDMPDGFGTDKLNGARLGVPRYPLGNGTRGYSLSSLVTAALNPACNEPKQPSNRVALNFTIST